MKILIDIGHPAHVHYFKNLINIMGNNKATINFIDDVRVFAGIVSRQKKDWEQDRREG